MLVKLVDHLKHGAKKHQIYTIAQLTNEDLKKKFAPVKYVCSNELRID